MRILIVFGGWYLPEFIGGTVRTVQEMCHAFARAGHDTLVLAPAGIGLGVRAAVARAALSGRGTIEDRRLDHPVLRTLSVPAQLAPVIRRFAPDAVISADRNCVRHARVARAAGLPTVVYLQRHEDVAAHTDPGFEEHKSDDPGLTYFAVSRHLADRYLHATGRVCAVVPPLVDPGRYRVESARRRALAVGANWIKGFDVVAALARACPAIPFDVYRSWTSVDRLMLFGRRRPKNLSVRRSTSDMRKAFAEARVVLVASRRETWGRVVTEAQVSAIPAIASATCGLPECVGDGGVLLPRGAPVQAWTEALMRLWHEPEHYHALSQAALAMAQRDYLQPDRIVETFLRAFAEPARFQRASPAVRERA